MPKLFFFGKKIKPWQKSRSVIKIAFADMWKGFDVQNNYFVEVLSSQYNIRISSNPDLLIYSCFGDSHKKFRCTKLFYTGENKPTNFDDCDYSISFERLNDSRQYHLPYGAFRIFELDALDALLRTYSKEEISQMVRDKYKFCAMVVSNWTGTDRNNFYEALNSVQAVDSGGKYQNNVGGPVPDKFEFIKEYLFVLSFENESSPGYLTEKIFDAFLVNSIPIYWGDPVVGELLNERRFFNRMNYEDDAALIKEIINVFTQPSKAEAMLSEPIFKDNILPDAFNKEKFVTFLFEICELARSKKQKFKKVTERSLL